MSSSVHFLGRFRTTHVARASVSGVCCTSVTGGSGCPEALLTRPEALRLPQTLCIACHGWVAPCVPLALDRPKELEGIPAPRVPPLEDVFFIGGEEALACIAPPFALGEGRRLEVPHHGPAPHAEVLGNRARRPALAVERPDLFVGGEPPRSTLCRPRLFLKRRRARRHRDSGPAVGLEHRCLADRVAHGFERVPVGAEDLIQRLGEVLHEMKAIGHTKIA